MDHPALNQQLSLFREEMAEDTEEVAKENRLKIPDGSADIGGLLKAVEVRIFATKDGSALFSQHAPQAKYRSNPKGFLTLLENLNEIQPSEKFKPVDKEKEKEFKAEMDRLRAEKDAEIRRLRQKLVRNSSRLCVLSFLLMLFCRMRPRLTRRPTRPFRPFFRSCRHKSPILHRRKCWLRRLRR